MNNTMTYQEALSWASSCIEGKNVDQNAPQFIITMLNDWSTTDWLLNRRHRIPAEQFAFLQEAVPRILAHEPAQYIVGKAPFYGRSFTVNDQVLVPESETEELIEWVLATLPAERPVRILDLGTGSGVIGITLKLERPQWQVTMSDLSPTALMVARQNAAQLGGQVTLYQSDVFDQLPPDATFDVIVTNPPYIADAERDLMDTAVLKYEPPMALFADHEGLAIYEQIALHLENRLAHNGMLFGETGFQQEKAIQTLFRQSLPTATVDTKHDINGLMRMVRVRLNQNEME